MMKVAAVVSFVGIVSSLVAQPAAASGIGISYRLKWGVSLICDDSYQNCKFERQGGLGGAKIYGKVNVGDDGGVEFDQTSVADTTREDHASCNSDGDWQESDVLNGKIYCSAELTNVTVSVRLYEESDDGGQQEVVFQYDATSKTCSFTIRPVGADVVREIRYGVTCSLNGY